MEPYAQLPPKRTALSPSSYATASCHYLGKVMCAGKALLNLLLGEFGNTERYILLLMILVACVGWWDCDLHSIVAENIQNQLLNPPPFQSKEEPLSSIATL